MILRRFLSTQAGPLASSSLASKSALVTGGSRGIGLAIAHAFARHGVACTLVGRNEETLREAVSSLPPVNGQLQHSLLVGDIASVDSWKVDSTRPIDILVNAAGMSQSSLLVRTSLVDISELLETNLRGTIYACHRFARVMLRQGNGGCIINVSSLLADKGGAGASVYAASKAGIIGLTRALAVELGPKGIRTNVILPGYVKTRMTQNLNETRLVEQIPLGRLGQPEEVAEAAVFLAKNEYANNCVLNLDGGLSAV